MRDLELDLLRAFVAVADAGSFTAAADTVGRSQSAVSQKIRRLEDLIGHPIFDRNSRSLALTGAGGQLLIGARRLLDLNDDVIRSLHVPETTGRLRVGICEDFVPLQLSRLLARFLRLHPGVQLDVNTSLTHSQWSGSQRPTSGSIRNSQCRSSFSSHLAVIASSCSRHSTRRGRRG